MHGRSEANILAALGSWRATMKRIDNLLSEVKLPPLIDRALEMLNRLLVPLISVAGTLASLAMLYFVIGDHPLARFVLGAGVAATLASLACVIKNFRLSCRMAQTSLLCTGWISIGANQAVVAFYALGLGWYIAEHFIHGAKYPTREASQC